MLSTKEAYGSVSVALHWSIAVLIVVALASGFAADVAGPSGHGALQVHVLAGGLAGVMTIVRLVWWWAFDSKPARHDGGLKRIAATIVHGLLVLLPLVMLASGIGMLTQSGALAQLFGGAAGALPDFEQIRPRRPHWLGAMLILVLVGVHVAAALYHHFVLRDGQLDRMRPSRRPAQTP